mmetsp:Transcript_70495/g.129123  ORF Transcript_70495/g.129123 Transcript_70495/m.129123 type:complete len:256 (+) Transcript_70495:80-847(+)
MGVIAAAPGALGGCSLLTAVELLCLVHMIVCIGIVCGASSVDAVNFAGLRISPFMQCFNGMWFLLGIPTIIVGGVGALFRVESHLKVYLAYLVGTMCVALGWLLLFFMYGNACNTVQPVGGQYKSQALVVCQASNGMVIFWMLVLIVIVGGASYVVWSMLEYVKRRHVTELLRYQEPWEAVVAQADEAAKQHAADRLASNTGYEKFASWTPEGYFINPYKPTMPATWAESADEVEPEEGYGSLGEAAPAGPDSKA